MEEPKDRLAQARAEAGYDSPTAAAKAFPRDINKNTLISHENGNRALSRQAAAKYAELFNVTAGWLLYGDRGEPSVPADRPRSISIPDLAIFAGMGGGGLLEFIGDDDGAPTDPEQVRGYWEIPEYMVRRFGDLKHIYAWEVRGDSMEPTIAGGSVVFVDTRQNKLPPNDLYALDYGDGLLVKRVKLVPRSDRVAIISDNERYGIDELLREEVRIWGRVIGWFQWRG